MLMTFRTGALRHPRAVSALTLTGMLIAYAGFAQEPAASPDMARFQSLAREAQACGPDLACINRVQQKMQALANELQNAAGAAGVTPGTPPPDLQQQAAQHQQRDATLRTALRSQEDDPCYAVIYQKQYAKMLHGSDLPWLSCVPLQIEVKWTVSERDGLEEFDGSYEVTQIYPGYLAVERSPQNRLKVLRYRIVSPAPQGRAQPSNRQSAGSATLTGVKYHGIIAATPYEKKTFGTEGVAGFSIADGDGSLAFDYDLMRPGGGSVISHQLTLHGPRVSVALKRNQADIVHVFWQPMLDAYSDTAFTRQEIEDGLERGRLRRSYPLQYAMAYLQQNGSAEVTILFNHEPGRLVVTPDTPVNSQGPECDRTFSPASAIFTLKNPGDSPIGYRIDGATAWATLSQSHGVLEAGASTTVSLKLEGKPLIDKPGTYQASLGFINTSNGRGSTQRLAKLTVNETQEWQVTLSGHYERVLWTPREILPPGSNSPQMIKDTRTYRFDYDLRAEVMIEKRKGKWEYNCGRVITSDIKYTYDHIPKNLWKVTKTVCLGCSTIKQMKGKPLAGQVSGSDLRLLWEETRPALEVTAELAAKCWQDPKNPDSCGYSQKGGTAYYAEDKFIGNARDHFLPLQNKTYKPGATQATFQRYTVDMDFSYAIKKLR